MTWSNVRQVTHVSPAPWVTSQKVDITCRTLEVACLFWLGCWSNNVANSHPSPSPLNSWVLHSCLVLQCSHAPHWPYHERHLANCDWIPASYTSRQLSYSSKPGTQPADIRRKGARLSLACRAMEHGHLLHCSTVHQVGMHAVSNRHIHLYSLDNINRSAVLWTDHQWNMKWLHNTMGLQTFISHTSTHSPWMDPLWRTVWSNLTTSALLLNVPSPACTNGVWPLLLPMNVVQKD